MRLRVLDLDGSVAAQLQARDEGGAEIINLRDWAPWVRLTCRHGTWQRFQRELDHRVGTDDDEPAITFIGSGDFHHVTLALLQRLREPFNLLVIDKHPDWMRLVPVMHCGTWLRHALRRPTLQNVFHIGGDLDFDNAWRWLAPWRELRNGRIAVAPAIRRYQSGGWPQIPHQPLLRPGIPSVADSLSDLFRRRRDDLARYPLYISVDKDAMSAAEAVVNWDSGTLAYAEVVDVLDWFREAAGDRLAGMDVVGDWSPVQMRLGLRTLCHWTEHPSLNVDPEQAQRINGRMNASLVAWAQKVPVRAAELSTRNSELGTRNSEPPRFVTTPRKF